jgi:hypothetical protein
MSYLRMTIGHWTLDLHSAEAGEVFQMVQEEGVSVFPAQPGFVRYRPMRADVHTTIAVAECESETLGTAGSLRSSRWKRLPAMSSWHPDPRAAAPAFASTAGVLAGGRAPRSLPGGNSLPETRADL